MGKKPLWLKSNCENCPNCGKITNRIKTHTDFENKKGFNCQYCNYHCSEEDFWEDFNFKAGRDLEYHFNDFDEGRYT